MGIMSKLLGFSEKEKTWDHERTFEDAVAVVEYYEAKLAELHRERKLAEAVLAARLKKREELLVMDAADDEVMAIDREVDDKRLLLERLELAESILLDRLKQARGARRQALWAEDLVALNATIDSCIEAGAAYLAAFRSHAAARETAYRHGFQFELAATALAPGYLSTENFEAFLRAVERQRDPPRPAPAVPALAPAQSTSSVPPKKQAFNEAPRAPKPRRAPLRQERKSAAERLVRILRNGYELPSGTQCMTGDVISLPAEEARQVVISGAGDFVDFPVSDDRIGAEVGPLTGAALPASGNDAS